MPNQRKLKNIDEILTRQLDLDGLSAVGMEDDKIVAMSNDTSMPCCRECFGPVKNHGKFSKDYLDVLVREDGSYDFRTIKYEFYKYRCLGQGNEKAKKCKITRTMTVKETTFAKENAKVTNRFEDLVVKLAVYMSYSQVENKLLSYVSKQAVGDIVKRWTRDKINKRGPFFTPGILGIVSFWWDKKPYALAYDAADRDIHIIDILPEVTSDNIINLINRMDRTHIRAVVCDCNQTIVDAVKSEIPGADVLVNTDALFLEVLHEFDELIRADAPHIANVDKKRLKKDNTNLREGDDTRIRDITKRYARVSVAYDHVNMLRIILSRDWDPTELRDWQYKIPITCKNEFQISAAYIDEFWDELLNYYKRRHEITSGTYEKLKKLDELINKFKAYSYEILPARVLYLPFTERDMPQKWRGIPLERIISSMDELIQKKERMKNECQ